MKPSIKTIWSYYRSGTLKELRDKGQMSEAEYQRLVKTANTYETSQPSNESLRRIADTKKPATAGFCLLQKRRGERFQASATSTVFSVRWYWLNR